MARTRSGKDAAAVALGAKGGRARARVLSRLRRVKIARQGAAARWRKASRRK
jgi:hypothetical protein